MSLVRQSFVFLAVIAVVARASSFLTRAQNAELKDLTPDMEVSILKEIEDVLGGGDATVTSGPRLVGIQKMLRTTFMSMPKNNQGRLGHAAVRYVLHSYFIQRHAWSVRGIGGLGAAVDTNPDNINGSSVTLQDKVEEFVQGAFERRLGAVGLDLEELSVLAAVYENLIRSETVSKLEQAFRLNRMEEAEEFNVVQVDTVLDTYMIGYILNLNYSALEPPQMKIVFDKIHKIYPSWPETKQFLRSIRSRSSSYHSFFSRTDIENMVEQLGDEYGHWQDKECLKLKGELVKLEDRTIGFNGSGRVRLGDFYGSALDGHNWQFSESRDYLIQLGVLDTMDVNMPRVVIPNYINSPANCLASSKFYAVCCINECESLMEHIEHHFAEPSASPQAMVEFISSLPSATVSGGRSLNPILTERLEDIAGHHGGMVPLHGRLFAQWMHHAYPRECPYPHISGTTNPQTPRDYARQQQKTLMASKEEMAEIRQHASKLERMSDDSSGGDECTTWSHHEELYVGEQSSTSKGRATWNALRPLPYVAAVAAVLAMVWRSVVHTKGVVLCSNGKDVFV